MSRKRTFEEIDKIDNVDEAKASIRKLSAKKLPVQVINCEVKASRYGEGYDVIQQSNTGVTKEDRCAVFIDRN